MILIHRGDSTLRAWKGVGSSATALNQLASRMELKSRPWEIYYRVSVHGTSAPKLLPSFHTRNSPTAACLAFAQTRRSEHSSLTRITVKSYTDAPGCEARRYRSSTHAATGMSNTQQARNTVKPYTRNCSKCPVFHIFLPANCTKPSCTKIKTAFAVHLKKRVG
jgi:hypothetical protein